MENRNKVEFIKEMMERTKKAAINTILLTRRFEKKKDLQVIVHQIVKSATSVGANYRAASRAISEKSLYSKMKIVEEEADETVFWYEILEEIYPKFATEYGALKNE